MSELTMGDLPFQTELRLPPYGIMDTFPAQLSLRRRPQVDASALVLPTIVSENVQRQLTATSEVTRWTITGLPPGVTMAVSGQLTAAAEKNRPDRKKPLSPAGRHDYMPPQTQYAPT